MKIKKIQVSVLYCAIQQVRVEIGDSRSPDLTFLIIKCRKLALMLYSSQV